MAHWYGFIPGTAWEEELGEAEMGHPCAHNFLGFVCSVGLTLQENYVHSVFCFACNIPVLGVETPAMSAPESLLTFKINGKGISAKKKRIL